MTTTSLMSGTFESTVVDNPIVLVDFWAGYCRPCQAFAPIYDRSAQMHLDVVHAKVDTQAEPELAATLGIRSVPTIMAFPAACWPIAKPVRCLQPCRRISSPR